MLRILFWLILTVTAVSCGNVKVATIGAGKVKSFAVTGCNHHICPMRNGDTYVGNMTFVANQNSSSIKIGVWLVINATAIPLPFESDGCADDELSNITPSCPIQKGRTYSVTRVLTPEGLIPGTKPIIAGQYYGDHGQILFLSTEVTAVA